MEDGILSRLYEPDIVAKLCGDTRWHTSDEVRHFLTSCATIFPRDRYRMIAASAMWAAGVRDTAPYSGRNWSSPRTDDQVMEEERAIPTAYKQHRLPSFSLDDLDELWIEVMADVLFWFAGGRENTPRLLAEMAERVRGDRSGTLRL